MTAANPMDERNKNLFLTIEFRVPMFLFQSIMKTVLFWWNKKHNFRLLQIFFEQTQDEGHARLTPVCHHSGNLDNVSAHSCPEVKTQFTELFNRTFNRFLVHFAHIFRNCKAWNPGLKEIEDISLWVNFWGEKMGFWPLFWFGLDWFW